MPQAFRHFPNTLSPAAGYPFFWDDVTRATYAYHPGKKLFATFDDKRSIALNTQYVVDKNLGGIMFWELGSDSYSDGLLHTIHQTLKTAKKASP